MLRVAVRSLLQHKLRSGLSILGIIFGVMAVLAMISIGEGAKKESIKQIEQLGTKNVYFKALSLTKAQKLKARERLSRGLSLFDVERFKQGIPDIQDVAYLKEVTAPLVGGAKEISPQVVAVSSNYSRVLNLNISHGRFLSDLDIKNQNLVCVVGDSVSTTLMQSGTSETSVRIGNLIFKIVGTLKQYDGNTTKASAITIRDFNEMVFIPLGTERSFNYQGFTKTVFLSEELTEIIVNMKKTEQVLENSGFLRRIMALSHGEVEDYQMIIPQELLLQSKKTQRTFNIVLASIASISLLVGGIGIMNIMTATVIERKKEIGIRRSVGATKEHIIFQFLTESVILTLSGGVLGIITGICSVWIITKLVGWITAITVWSLVLPLIMSIFVGIFFGLYPAYKAAEMDPIIALRDE